MPQMPGGVVAFFEDMDERIAGTHPHSGDAGSRAALAAARPLLWERAVEDPEKFERLLDETLERMFGPESDDSGEDWHG